MFSCTPPHHLGNDVKSMAGPLVKGTIAVYNRISAELLPTPAKSHYTFNLRDVSKTFQGLLMIKPAAVPNKLSITRLWAHECMRVFHDRLIDGHDQRYFKELVVELVQGTFSLSWARNYMNHYSRITCNV